MSATAPAPATHPRPRLLDLYAGAGGAARGYHQAGFTVVGVDHKPQPRYPFEFHQADALTFPLDGYDAIHASPPCQAYARVTAWRGHRDNHPDLIAPTRARLLTAGVPYIIENVPEAPVRRDGFLCGTMFGLPVRRHRIFETNWTQLLMPSRCRHSSADLAFEHKQERAYADAMECSWMTSIEAREAIPPAFTAYLGRVLLERLERAA